MLFFMARAFTKQPHIRQVNSQRMAQPSQAMRRRSYSSREHFISSGRDAAYSDKYRSASIPASSRQILHSKFVSTS